MLQEILTQPTLRKIDDHKIQTKPTSRWINDILGSAFLIILVSGLSLTLPQCHASTRSLLQYDAPTSNFSISSNFSGLEALASNNTLDTLTPTLDFSLDASSNATLATPMTSNASLDAPSANISLDAPTSNFSIASNYSSLDSPASNVSLDTPTPTSNVSFDLPSNATFVTPTSNVSFDLPSNATFVTPTSNNSLDAPQSNSTSNVTLNSPSSTSTNFSLPSPSSASNASLAVPPTNVSALAAEIVFNRTDGLCFNLVIPQGDYKCTEFMVPTNDGFLLGVQRVSSNNVPPTKGAVFLMHGILVGGDVWVLNEPTEALAFILADAGYDVWIGNTRTTKFSFGHITLQRNDHEFWDWSVDELAQQDLPAMLNFVSQTIGDKMHYIGYSQGSQQAFAAFSQGQLVSLVDRVVMLAPIAFVDHGSAPVEIGLFDFHIDQILELANVHEFSTQTRTGSQMVEIICRNNAQCFESWVFLFAGDNCCLNMTKRSLLEKYETQATSVKNLVHLAQQGRSSSFAKFDYGLFGNLMHYGSSLPPRYPLENVPSDNLLLINGLQDALADPTDVSKLVANLGGIVNTHTHPTFGHLDFILADSASTQVYPQILSFLEA